MRAGIAAPFSLWQYHGGCGAYIKATTKEVLYGSSFLI